MKLFLDPKTCPTHVIKIYIAGDRNLARQVLQEYVMRGACVSISEEEYIYTMGNEAGIVEELLDQARDLADELLVKLFQGSCTVVDYSGESYFISRRSDD